MATKITAGESIKALLSYHWKGMFTIVVPLLCSPLLFLGQLEYKMLYCVVIMAIFWITEVIPLWITSLIPIAALPAMGILDSATTAQQYFRDALAIFIGGLFVALAIEYCQLHRRLALGTILIVGCSPRRLHFGVTLVAMFISMWISNSAATAMMCPIIRAVLDELEGQKVLAIYLEDDKEAPLAPGEKKKPSRIATAYYLGAAYATTIGGCGTLIGTGTNLTFKGIYETRFPQATEEINFPLFMAYCVPWMLISTFLMFLAVEFHYMGLFRPGNKENEEIKTAMSASDQVRSVILQRYRELGPMSCHEIQVTILFLLMIALLFTRSPGFVKGWADVLNAVAIRGSLAVMVVVILLFMFPINYYFFKFCCGKAPFPAKDIPSLLSWKYININSPWGLVFLLGGGFALAAGSRDSGMAAMLGTSLKKLNTWPEPLVQLMSIIVSMFMTAFSSNVAICNIIVPVLSEMAVAIKVHPLYLIFPSGLACSMAFHLPVSTPPNAIVAGYANVQTKEMAILGIGPSLITCITIFINCQTWHFVIYPNSGTFPDWAVT